MVKLSKEVLYFVWELYHGKEKKKDKKALVNKGVRPTPFFICEHDLKADEEMRG